MGDFREVTVIMMRNGAAQYQSGPETVGQVSDHWHMEVHLFRLTGCHCLKNPRGKTMSKQRKALLIALDALNRSDYLGWQANIPVMQLIREALAEPEPWTPDDMAYRPGGLPMNAEQEPVARVKTVGGYPDASEHTVEWLVKFKDVMSGQLLYTAPPARKPLSYMEACTFIALNIEDGAESLEMQSQLVDLIRAVERAHGIGSAEQ